MMRKDMEKWIAAVRYGRASTTKQEASLDDQRSWAVGACPAQQIRIVAEFEDDGIAGDEIARRQALQDLFAFVESEQRAGRPIECLVVWDMDRLSRADSVRTAVILDRLREAGVGRVFCQEGWVDLNDELTITMQHLKQDFSRRGYSRSMSKNVARSCLERAKRGEWCGGRAPYGYRIAAVVVSADRREHYLELDERDGGARGAAVAWMFRTYLERDTSLTELARDLERRGVPPPDPDNRRSGTPGRWTPGSVQGIMRNPVYTGHIHYGRRSKGKYHRVLDGAVAPATAKRGANGSIKQQANAEERCVVSARRHPELVAPALAEAVRRKMAGNGPAFKPGTTRRTFKWLFGGLLRCAHCGEVMWGLLRRDPSEDQAAPRQGYVCSTYRKFGRGNCTFNFMPEEQLLVLVACAIRDYFSDPALLAQVKEQLRLQERATQMEGADVLPRWTKRAADLKALIAQASVRLAQIPDDLLEGLIRELRSWKEDLAKVQAEIAAAKVQQQTGRQLGSLMESGLARLQDLPALLGRSDRALVREVMRSVVAGIELHFGFTVEGKASKRRSYVFSHGTITTTPIAQALGIADRCMFSNEVDGKPCASLLQPVIIRFAAA